MLVRDAAGRATAGRGEPTDRVSVSVLWPAVAGAVPVSDYEIRVYHADNGVPRSVVGTRGGTVVGALTCAETPAPEGRWYYTVTQAAVGRER